MYKTISNGVVYWEENLRFEGSKVRGRTEMKRKEQKRKEKKRKERVRVRVRVKGLGYRDND